MGNRLDLDLLEGDEFIGQQSERPGRTTLRWLRTRQCDQPRLTLTVQASVVRAVGLLAVDGIEATVRVAFPHIIRRVLTAIERVGDRAIWRAGIGLEENPSPRDRWRTMFPRADELLQFRAFFLGQIDGVLLPWHQSISELQGHCI